MAAYPSGSGGLQIIMGVQRGEIGLGEVVDKKGSRPRRLHPKRKDPTMLLQHLRPHRVCNARSTLRAHDPRLSGLLGMRTEKEAVVGSGLVWGSTLLFNFHSENFLTL